MKIVNTSIKQPVFITMVISMFLVLGIVSYTRIGVDLLPDISLPIVAITTIDPGVGPEEIESQVTKPIEDVVSSINGLDKVSSTSSEGVSVVVAEFKLEKDPDKAEQEIRDKFSSIRSTLPREILEPVIDKFDPASSPIISYAILSKGNKQKLSEIRLMVEDSIKPQIERIDGVGSITILKDLFHVLMELNASPLLYENNPELIL